MSDDVVSKLLGRKDLENPTRAEVLSALKEVSGHAGQAARILKMSASERKKRRKEAEEKRKEEARSAAAASRAMAAEGDSAESTAETPVPESDAASAATSPSPEPHTQAVSPVAVSVRKVGAMPVSDKAEGKALLEPLLDTIAAHRWIINRKDAAILFSGQDTKRVGWVNEDGLKTAMGMLGLRISFTQTEQLMQAQDSYSGGMVMISDFCDTLYARRMDGVRSRMQSNAKMATGLFRTYADGLAFDVFKDVMRSDAGITARGADGVVDEDLRNVFDSIDTDNDGIISADAFAAAFGLGHKTSSWTSIKKESKEVAAAEAAMSPASRRRSRDAGRPKAKDSSTKASSKGSSSAGAGAGTGTPIEESIHAQERASISIDDSDLEKLLDDHFPQPEDEVEVSGERRRWSCCCCWRRPKETAFSRVTHI